MMFKTKGHPGHQVYVALQVDVKSTIRVIKEGNKYNIKPILYLV